MQETRKSTRSPGTVTWTLAAALSLAVALSLVAAAPAGAQEERAIDETRSVDRDVSVTAEIVNRTVRVTGTDGAELRIRGSYYPEYEEFELEGDGGSVTITLELREDEERHWDDDMEPGPLTIELPRGASLEVGDVNGSVLVSEGDGTFERIRAQTLSGDIEFRGRPAGNGSLEFETHSGDVDLHLPADLSARLEAEVFSGDIESAFGGEPAKESRYTPSMSYEYAVGSGGALISAVTFSGDVRFLRDGG